jgi:hypothetical protein
MRSKLVKLSIRSRLYLGYGILALLVLTIGLLGINAIAQVSRALERVEVVVNN